MLGLGNSIITSGAPSEFTIDSLSSAVHWYKFSGTGEGITLNGSDVAQWNDSIGSNHLTQSDASKQPAYNSGNISFNAATTIEKLEFTSKVNLLDLTICVVVDFSGTTPSPSNETLLGSSVGSDADLLRFAAGGGQLQRNRIQVDDVGAGLVDISTDVTDPDYPTTTKYVFTVTRDADGGNGNGLVTMYADETNKGSGNFNADVSTDNFGIDQVGAQFASSNSFAGQLSEMVMFNAVLSDADRALVIQDIKTRNSIS